MEYKNSQWPLKKKLSAPLDLRQHTLLEEYDFNVCLPKIKVLETDKVRLEPFLPSKHFDETWSFMKTPQGRETWKHMDVGPFDEPAELLEWFEKERLDVKRLTFAIIDKATSQIAGIINYCHIDPVMLSTELGYVIVFTHFQRTHVLTHAAYALLSNAFDDLGFSRVQWWAFSENAKSRNAAERLGFEHEGILRNIAIVGQGHGGRRRSDGRFVVDGAYLGITDEDWKSGKRERLAKMLVRN